MTSTRLPIRFSLALAICFALGLCLQGQPAWAKGRARKAQTTESKQTKNKKARKRTAAKKKVKRARKAPQSRTKKAMVKVGKRVGVAKQKVSKALRIPQLTASLERGMNKKWVHRAARATLTLGGTAIASYGAYKYGLHDLGHMAAMTLAGFNVFALSFVPDDQFWGRLKTGLLGAHETKLGIALTFLAHDPIMQFGALMLSLHGTEKVVHAVFKDELGHH